MKNKLLLKRVRYFLPFLILFLFLTFLTFLTIFPLPAYAAGGDVVWQYGDAKTGKQEAKAMAVDSSGNIILTGYQLLSGTDNDFYTVKINSDGSGVAWTAPYNNSGKDDQAVAVAGDSENNIIVTGHAQVGSKFDFQTIKYNGSTGAVLWQDTFNGSANGNDEASAVAVDSLNDIYIAGHAQNASGNDDYLILKYSPNGTLLWQKTYGGSGGGEDRITSITAGFDGIAVTGYSWNGADFDYMTIKYGFDGTKLWEQRYSSSGTNNDRGLYVKMDSSGNVVVTGYLSNGTDLDIYTAKYNGSTGALIWEKTYNGGYDDEPRGLWIGAQGNVYVTGYTWTLTGHYDFYTAKYNGSNGSLIWDKPFNSGSDNDDIAIGILVDVTGDVFVTGYASSAGNYDFQTIKYQKDNGNQLWQSSFNGSANKNDRPVGIGLSSTGEALVAGWSDMWTSGASDYDYYAIKYDPGLLNAPTNLTAAAVSNIQVDLSWSDNSANEDGFKIERKIGSSGTYAEITTVGADVTTYNDNNGGAGLAPDTKYYYRVRAYNAANGNSHYSNEANALTTIVSYQSPTWSYIYDAENNDDYAAAIAVGPDNNPVVTGFSFSTSGTFDYYTLKLNRTDGSVVWSARYDDPDNDLDVATCVSVDNNNDALVSGYSSLWSQAAGQNTNDVYTIKYPSTGPPESWHDAYDGPVHNDDRSTAVATANDASNNIVVAGYGRNAAFNDDIYVIKYLSNGARAWIATPYDGGGNDYPAAVAFDSAGNIFLTGYTHNGTDYDFFTRKYDGNGNVLWTDTFNGGYGDDVAKAIAVDSSGNPHVTGSVINSSGNKDFYTIKYNGATKAKIWERTFGGAAAGDDMPESIRIDPIDGNIVVSGTSLSSTGNNDYHIIRYDSDGNAVWAKTLDRPANDDYVVGMAMDLSGNVCVAGNTSNGSTIDIMSVKYNYEGAVIGATIFNGAADNFDNASAVTSNNYGEAFIAGYSINSSGNADYVVYKCAWDSLQVPTPFNAAPAYTKVDLTWVDNSTAEDGYTLQRKIGGCSTSDINNSCNPGDMGCPWTWSYTLPANSTAYADNGLNIGTTYCYRIKAFKNNGEASRWIGKSVATLIPGAPSNFNVTPANTTQINLSWTDNTTGETGFKIERCTGSGCTDFAEIDTAGPDANAYSDTTVCNSTSYTYRVKAYKTGEWDSEYTTPQSATSLTAATPSLTATRASEAQINLSWTDGNSDETGFEILRCEGAGCTPVDPPIVTVSADVTTYNNNGLAKDTLYRYIVRAYKTATCGWSAASSTSEATTTLISPSSLTTTAINTTQINLSWSDNSGSETNFKIERCTGAGCSDFAEIASANPNATTYSDASACNSTTYNYRVKATNEGLSNNGGGCWTRRVPLTITNFQPDFQTKITIAYDADMQADFDDIRFFDVASNTELPYWMESKTNGSSATIWIKTGANNNIYMYYGNPGATSTSSGTGLFEFFDDFRGTTIDTSKWVEIDSDNSIYQNNDLILNDVSDSWTRALISKQTFTRAADKKIYMKFTIPADTPGDNHFMAGWELDQTTNASYTQLVHGMYWNNYLLTTYEKNNHTGPNTQAYAAGTDYEMKIELKSAGANYYIKGGAYSDWTQVVPSTVLNYTDSPMRIAFTQYSHQANIHFIAVQKYVSTEPGITVGAEEQSACFVFANTWVSSYTNEAFATTSTPAAPGLTSTRASETQINLSWTDGNSDETGFKIERCAGTGCTDFAEIAAVGANTTTYQNTGLSVSTIYRYRVRSYKTATCGWDLLSNESEATTSITPPSGLSAGAVNTTQINLSWTDNTVSETGFKIERCAGAGCTDFAEVGWSGTTTYSDASACNSTTYNYRVKAVNEELSNSGGGCWTRRVPLTITNFQPDFQTKITVAYDADMQTDFDDIRFYDETAYRELPYWIESKTDGFSATVWVKTGANNNIYMYYGNPSATGVSNGNNTFEFFDDFTGTTINTSKWTEVDTATNYFTQNNELISSGGNSGWNIGLYSVPNFTRPFVFEVNHYHTGGNYMMLGAKDTESGVSYTNLVHAAYIIYDGNGNRLQVYEDGAYRGQFNAISSGVWQYYKLEVFNTGAKYYYGNSPASYSLFYTGSYSSETPLKVGLANHSQAFKLDNARVRKYASTEPAIAAGTEEQSACFTFADLWASAPGNEAFATTPAPFDPTGLSATPVSESQIDISWTDTNTDETGFKIERKAEACEQNTLPFVTLVPISDTFDTVIDSEIWNQRGILRDAGTGVSQDVAVPPIDITDGNGTARITPSSGIVELYATSAGGGTADYYNSSRLLLKSPGVIRGDFDTQIDYSLPDGQITAAQYHVYARLIIYFPNTANGSNYAYVERAVGASGNYYYGAVSIDGTSQGNSISTSDASGKFRIKRTGSSISTYVWTGSAWTLLREVTGASTSAPTYLYIAQYAQRNEAVSLKANVDNFILNVSDADITTFSDTNLSTGITYCYRVRARKTATCSWESNYITAAATTLTPPAPTNLTANAVNTTQIDLSWTDNTGSETGFVIQRCTGAGCTDFMDLVTVGANVTSYSDATACYSTAYTYQVRATKSTPPVFDTTYSAPASATTSAPVALSGVTATRASEVQINLSWTDTNTDETGFEILRCEGSGCTPTDPAVAAVGAGISTYSDIGLANSTTYRYIVRVYKTASGCAGGEWAIESGIVEVVTSVSAPGAVTATAANTTQINLAWTDNAGAETNFKIERCEGVGCSSFAEIATVNPRTTTYSDTTVCNTTTYNYRIKAVNEGMSNHGGGCWTRRVPLTITNFQPDFQIKITVAYDADMQSDFDDIRFYDETDRMELPYWIESKTNGTSATVWIKTGANNNIYMYYGNPSAASTSSTIGTFIREIDGVRGAWTFDEGTGTAANDYSGNGNNGTFYNTPVWSTGKFKNALSFNGSNTIVYRTSGNNLPLGNSPRTYAAWIKPAGYPDATYNGIVAYGSTAANSGSLLSIKNDGRLSMAFWSNDTYQTTGNAATLNEWNHAAFAYSGGTTVKFYMNGQFVQESSLSGGAANTQNGYIRLGSTDYVGRVFNGLIDEIRMYDKALTDSEILDLYNNYGYVTTNYSGKELVRKYASTEPAAALGAEEQSACFAFTNIYDGPYSDVAVATTPTPAAPTLTATRYSEARINLSWTDGNSDETGFEIWRCEGSGCGPAAGALIYTAPADTTSYNNTGLTHSTIYRYIVKAYKTATCGWGMPGSVSEATTTIIAASGLTATPVNTTQIDLSWTDNTATETGFEIWRCEGLGCDPAAGTLIYTTASDATSYSDTGICKSTSYSYMVRAVKSGDSTWPADIWSNLASATTPTPTVPSGLTATAATDTAIDLVWTETNADETGFKIERCAGDGCTDFAEIGAVGPSVTAYQDATAQPSITYCYRVRAYKTTTCGWDTGYSNTACDLSFSAHPINLTATPLNAFKIKLDWTDVSVDEVGFEIEVQAWNGKWVNIATVGAGITTFTDTRGIEPQKEYRYRVRAVRGSDKSPYSNEASATTPARQSGDDTCN